MNYTLCKNCGQPDAKHRTLDMHCLGKTLEPKWPTSIKDEKKAGALYDKRLVKYWSQRSTYFSPKL